MEIGIVHVGEYICVRVIADDGTPGALCVGFPSGGSRVLALAPQDAELFFKGMYKRWERAKSEDDELRLMVEAHRAEIEAQEILNSIP